MSATSEKLRIVVAGDSGVGKTSIILNYANNIPASSTTPSVGVDYRSAVCDIDGTKYKLEIWDTAGQERFRSCSAGYFRRSDGIMLFYAIDSEDSFSHLGDWKQLIDDNKSEGAPIILIGNKSDLTEGRTVDAADGENCAIQLGCKFVETSAKSGEGVHDAFQLIAKAIIASKRQAQQPVTVQSPPPEPIVEIAQSDPKKKQKGRC
jgi:small GTP-binding protein